MNVLMIDQDHGDPNSVVQLQLVAENTAERHQLETLSKTIYQMMDMPAGELAEDCCTMKSIRVRLHRPTTEAKAPKLPHDNFFTTSIAAAKIGQEVAAAATRGAEAVFSDDGIVKSIDFRNRVRDLLLAQEAMSNEAFIKAISNAATETFLGAKAFKTNHEEVRDLTAVNETLSAQNVIQRENLKDYQNQVRALDTEMRLQRDIIGAKDLKLRRLESEKETLRAQIKVAQDVVAKLNNEAGYAVNALRKAGMP